MEDELKKAEQLSHKDPEMILELLSAIGMYLPRYQVKLLQDRLQTNKNNRKILHFTLPSNHCMHACAIKCIHHQVYAVCYVILLTIRKQWQ
jgi:hypothetical protein